METEIDDVQKEQVDNMLADFFPPTEPVTEEPANEPIGEEDKVVEGTEAAEEAPVVEDTKGEEGGQQEEPKPEPEPVKVAESEPSEIEEIKKQNEMLLQRIEELSGKIITTPAQPVEEAKPDQAVVLDLIGDNDIDDILASKELFNQTINKAMQIAEERAIQKVLLSIPNVVMRQTQQQMAIHQATNEFYRDNPDLEPVKKTVAAVANEIYSTNPQMTIGEIFQKSAEKTREILGLRNKALKTINEQGRVPEFVQRTQGNRGKQSTPNVDKFQQELNDLLNF